MKYYTLRKGEYSKASEQTNDKQFVGKWWSVKNEGSGRYIFEYISGELQGNIRIKEISQEDYELTRKEEIGFDQLFRKYVIDVNMNK